MLPQVECAEVGFKDGQIERRVLVVAPRLIDEWRSGDVESLRGWLAVKLGC